MAPSLVKLAEDRVPRTGGATPFRRVNGMAGTGGTQDGAERVALRHALRDLDAQLAMDVERGPGAR